MEMDIKEEFNKKKYSFFLIAIGLVLITVVAVVSLLRERIVSPIQNQVTVYGTGKVEYKPNTANVTLGVRVDRAGSAGEALEQLNVKIKKINDAVLALGIPADDIKTQNYNLYPNYDYKDGISRVSGYNANQNIIIKVRKVDENLESVNKVVAVAGDNGTNEIQGVNYYIDDISVLKQKARILALEDARKKAGALAKAAGIRRLGKVVSWYEDAPMPVDNYAYSDAPMAMGMGGFAEAKSSTPPQISSGTQDIVVNMGVNFEVK